MAIVLHAIWSYFIFDCTNYNSSVMMVVVVVKTTTHKIKRRFECWQIKPTTTTNPTQCILEQLLIILIANKKKWKIEKLKEEKCSTFEDAYSFQLLYNGVFSFLLAHEMIECNSKVFEDKMCSCVALDLRGGQCVCVNVFWDWLHNLISQQTHTQETPSTWVQHDELFLKVGYECRRRWRSYIVVFM